MKKIIGAIVTWSFFGGGVLLGGLSISKFQNYKHPYLFGFLLAILGLIAGAYLVKMISKQTRLYFLPADHRFLFRVGLPGYFMFFGFVLNQSLSKLERCDKFVVIAKEYQSGGSKGSPLNILVVDIDGQDERIICSRTYWQIHTVGQKVDVCIYKSMLGFDAFDLPYN